MIKKLGIIGMIGLTILVTSCNNSNTKDTDTQNQGPVTKGENQDADKPAYARYNFKSGIITYKATILMMDQEIVTYFDDWGRSQRNEVKVNFMGQKANTITVSDSSYAYTWEQGTKVGKRLPIDPSSPENMNYNDLTDDLKKKYGITEEGTAKVLDRECKVYAMVFPEAGIKGKYYVWNGIALKTDASANGLGIIMEATKIEENAVVPAEKFTIPKDIIFQDAKNAADATNIKI